MLASNPASILNQKPPRARILKMNQSENIRLKSPRKVAFGVLEP